MATKFLPKNQHPVTVCNHRNGADVTISEVTDTLQEPSKVAMEYYIFGENFPCGAYIGPHYVTDYYDLREQERLGTFRHDLYLNQADAATALNKTGLSLAGTDYAGIMAVLMQWMQFHAGRRFSAVSFAGGNEALALNTKNDFATGRNSQTGANNYGKVGNTFLGQPAADFSALAYSNRPTTIRWWDKGPELGTTDPAVLLPYVDTAVDDAIATGGWLLDFVHLHNIRIEGSILYQRSFMQRVKARVANAGKKAVYGSAGQAVEYMALREFITTVRCCDVYDRAILAFEVSIPTADAFIENFLNTPISVQVDLSGSLLAGKNICAPGCEIISKGGDVYILNIPYKGTAGNGRITMIEIYEGIQAYRTETRPTATSVRGANYADITFSAPCTSMVFSRLTGQDDTMWLKHTRQMNYATTRRITNMNFSTREYAIGFSDEFKNLNLIPL